MFRKYIEYLKNNPEGYWFKRKLYGWGWTPAKWQGWVILAIFLLFVLYNVLNLSPEETLTQSELLRFFVRIILAVGVLIFICYKKGEKPRWQWGLKDQ